MNPPPTIRDIQSAVGRAYGVTGMDLISRRGSKAIYRPRQVAMWIARHLTLRSLPEIGRAFGRDHTTVGIAVRRIDALMARDHVFAVKVWALMDALDHEATGEAMRALVRMAA
jgi:chromosomal replication initiator protein